MNIRETAFLLILASGASACSASVVDLGATFISTSNEPGVVAVVHERVEKLIVDDERLYWIGTHVPSVAGNVWLLHSCLKLNCATTLVTYDAQSNDVGRNFSVSSGQIYWYRSDVGELLSCPIAGCDGAPRSLAPELVHQRTGLTGVMIDQAGFDDEYFYYPIGFALLNRLPLLEPGPHQLLAQSLSAIQSIAIQGAYAYWVAKDQIENKQQLLRARKGGASGVETITSDLNVSLYRGFGFTTDESSLYWTNNTLAGSISRCPLAGCPDDSAVLLSPLRAPQNLLIDGMRLYYEHEVEAYDYALSSCALPACVASALLQEHLDAPSVLALDDRYLYVATTEQDISPNNTNEDTIARIRRLPKLNPESP